MNAFRKNQLTAAPPRPDAESLHKELRILLLEDSLPHVELVERVLHDGGVECAIARVDTEDGFRSQLERFLPDLILSDYALPAFDGLAALQIAKQKAPDVPFIFVTGTMGEEVAIETLKNGATDYVLKTRLSRLVPAVQRALREAGERRERKRAEERLQRTNEQLRALSAYLQYVREEERTRIAREVHDELGQNLTGLKLDLSWLGNQFSGRGSRTLRTKVKELLAHVDGTIQTVRRIATELRPSILDDLGLVAAIEWQTNDFQNRTGIRCSVSCRVPEILWDHDFTTVFFRIFQETLTNIIRHANATRVAVRLEQENGSLILEIEDNGRGITEKEIANTRSIGLIGMRERAALVGGDVSFRGGPGIGTTVRVKIPLPQAAEGRTG